STVLFDIKNSLGRQFRIIQMVEQQPVSMEGDQLDWQSVECIGHDARKGTSLSDLTPLAPKQQVIYQSSPSGDADSFTIGYVFDPNAVQKAGQYKTVVKYLLDMVGSDLKLLDTFGLNVENPRVFELIVKPVSGGVIRFTDVKATQSPKVSEVQIEIKSNVGKQYQITQTVPSPLVNKEGNTIPFKNFTLKEESTDTKGLLKFPSASEVVVGDTTLFVSDSKGSPDKFKIFYELAPSLEIKAGDYSTRIMYSISEL
ncbi:MAG: hypothetical protein PHE58_01750, partial [Candidatus Omnitrophica bacterium]|nr:hypothetical protein [Candidatus Omnitrophota bacterium]